MKHVPHFNKEAELAERGKWPVAGVDEVGRGPLAGPVVACAVILDPQHIPKNLQDSKKLTASAREGLFEEIMKSAWGVGVSFVPHTEIDRFNIRQASLLAMQRALLGLSLTPAYALVDGRDVPPCLGCEAEAIVKGDSISASIASASIVAKVLRDRSMRHADRLDPRWQFGKHMGYPTSAHLDHLKIYGISPLHRRSFAPVRSFYQEIP